MAVRDIITVGDDRLRQTSRKIEEITAEVQTLIDHMIETLHANNGVGLAAVQVGELVRLIIVETPEDEEEPGSGELYVVINPEIVEAGEKKEPGLEGCLSVPGYVGEVARHTRVTVRGRDRQGRPLRLRAQGFLARVFQHEIDHTEGVLYIDRLTEPDRLWPVEEGEEERREAEQARV
ncbi:MAG: peptide deformylase [Anaerolineae bacterium]